MAMLYHNPGPGVAHIGGVLILPGEARDVDADRMPAPVSALASDIAGDPDDKGDTGEPTESSDAAASPAEEPAAVKRRQPTTP